MFPKLYSLACPSRRIKEYTILKRVLYLDVQVQRVLGFSRSSGFIAGEMYVVS